MIIDTILIVMGGLCVLVGLLGCILPVLPGPVIAYTGLILLQLTSSHPFTINFLVIYGILTVIVGLIDYIIPIYGTKKLEGSKYGVWGSAIGLAVGLIFLLPLGILIGPMFGALIGEIIGGKHLGQAIKPAMGSFLGFLAGTVVKLILTAAMGYHFTITIISFYSV